MTEAASKLLAEFESLSPDDQFELAREIMRRSPMEGELSEAGLHQVADDLFLATMLTRTPVPSPNRGEAVRLWLGL
jgi:hypothetical protein